MDITLAKTFLAIAESGSFNDAADRLHVTQSTISSRIKTLEDLLGKSLLERSKSGAKLTPAGEGQGGREPAQLRTRPLRARTTAFCT